MDNQDMERMGIPVVSEPVQQKPSNGLATASLVMGIMAVVTCCCFYSVFLFGGLGLIFGFLSRTEQRFEGQAKAGVILSIIGFVLTFVLWGGFLLYIFNLPTDSGISNMPAFPDLPESLENWENILALPWRNL